MSDFLGNSHLKTRTRHTNIFRILILWLITEWVSRSGSFAGSSMAVLLGVALLGFAVTLLTLTICLVRRRTSRLSRTSLAPAKQIEVTHGHDQRYVVAYQLKPEAKPKQPDILNRGV